MSTYLHYWTVPGALPFEMSATCPAPRDTFCSSGKMQKQIVGAVHNCSSLPKSRLYSKSFNVTICRNYFITVSGSFLLETLVFDSPYNSLHKTILKLETVLFILMRWLSHSLVLNANGRGQGLANSQPTCFFFGKYHAKRTWGFDIVGKMCNHFLNTLKRSTIQQLSLASLNLA